MCYTPIIKQEKKICEDKTMKKFTKIFVAITAVTTLAVSALALAGCTSVTPVAKELEGYQAEEFGFCVQKGNADLKAKLDAFILTDGVLTQFNQSKDFHSGVEGATALELPNLEDNTGVTYTMITEAGYDPYETEPGVGTPNTYKGFKGCDVDMMVLFAESQNAKLNILNVEFNSITTKVNESDKYIGAAAITIDEERKEVVDFSVPYEGSKQYILSGEENAYSKIEQLEGKKVAVQTGTTAHVIVMNDAVKEGGALFNKGTTVKTYDKIMVAFQDLKKGNIDAIVLDEMVAKNLLSKAK